MYCTYHFKMRNAITNYRRLRATLMLRLYRCSVDEKGYRVLLRDGENVMTVPIKSLEKVL